MVYPLQDITNQEFNQLTAKELTNQRNSQGYRLWRCDCSCGNTHYASCVDLRANKVKSCGCRPTKQVDDLTGRTFHWLKVDGIYDKTTGGHYRYDCTCKCGNKTIVERQDLINGDTKSCGCYNRANRWRGYGQISGSLWNNITQNAKRRGITLDVNIIQAWELFLQQKCRCALSGVEIWFADRVGAGDKVNTASLDRIDSSKPYTLDNIQWVHKHINNMKQSLSDNEFVEWCRRVVQCHQS